jgi:hypothetical protein
MRISREKFQIKSTLVGFHSFKKDHNYNQFKGSLINEFSNVLNETFNVVPQFARETILKSIDPNKQYLEIRITSNTLLFQDVTPTDDVVSKAHKLLEVWRQFSPLVNLRLVGVVFEFTIDVDQSNAEQELFIIHKFLKRTNWDKLIYGDFTLRFNQTLESIKYNIQLMISENNEENPVLVGTLDFNQISSDIEHSHSDDDINRIIDRAKKYFNNELIDFLNNN